MKEDKNLEQKLDKSNKKLHISDVIPRLDNDVESGMIMWYNGKKYV
jgi:hypothetical protein